MQPSLDIWPLLFPLGHVARSLPRDCLSGVPLFLPWDTLLPAMSHCSPEPQFQATVGVLRTGLGS